jgi:hypothetical protein
MAIVAGDVLLMPILDGTALHGFSIFTDPLARGRHGLERGSKFLLAILVLVYGRWTITSARVL